MIKNHYTLIKKRLYLFLLFQLVFLLMLSLPASVALAQTKASATESLGFTPQISIPDSEFAAGTEIKVGEFDAASGEMQSDLLGRYMLAIINYALAAVAILATVVLMGGGLLWLTSRGDSGQVSKAKGLIGGSITGLILLLCSWIILNTINPKLTEFQSIDTKVVEPENYQIMTCCHPTNGPTYVKIETKDGKKIALGGVNKGKEIKCKSDTPECTNDNVCAAYNSDNGKNGYKCVPDNFCCSCISVSGSTGGGGAGSNCIRNVSLENCTKSCENSAMSIYPSNYVCGNIPYVSGSSCVAPK